MQDTEIGEWLFYGDTYSISLDGPLVLLLDDY